MLIRGRLRFPGTPTDRASDSSEQLQSTTTGSGEGTGEADGAFSGARGDNEVEKGLDVVSPVPTGDLDDVGWREGGFWEVFLDHGTAFRVDDKRTGSQVW